MTQKVGGVEFDIVIDGSKVTSAVAKSEAELKKLQDAFMKVEGASVRAMEAPAKKAPGATQGLKNMRHAAGQLGFQVQDMAVQLQSGTSAMVVLGQQGSQVASIFGPTGAIVGGVIAVGAALAGVLVPSMMDSSDETETLTEKLKELQKESKLTANQQAALAQIEAEAAAEKKKTLAEIDAEIKEKMDLIETNKGLIETGRSLSSLRKDQSATGRIEALKAENEETRKQLILLRAQRDLEAGATGGPAFDEEKNKQAVKSTAQRIAAITQAVDLENEIISNGIQRRIAIEEGFLSQSMAMLKEDEANRIANQNAKYQTLIEAMNQERVAILENESLTGTQRQALINELDNQAAYAKLNHENRLTEIEKNAAEKRMQIAEMERQAKINALSSTFSNLSSLMNTESKKLFEIGKAAAVAGAIVDGYAAVSKTMASVPYPFNIPLAAAQAVASAAQVKGILSTKFGDKNPGQVFAGGQAATPVTGQQGPQQQTRNVNIATTGGGENVNIRELIGMLNEAAGDGVQFNLTTGG